MGSAPPASSSSELRRLEPRRVRVYDPVLDCPSCHAELDDDGNGGVKQHECCICRDTRRVRTHAAPGDPGFGLTQLCPGCTGPADKAPPAPTHELARMGVPTRYLGARFDAWLPSSGAPRKAVEEYVAVWPPARPLLLLTGNVGTGKTMLACAAVYAAWQRHGQHARFFSVVDLLARYRATFDEENRSETPEQVDAQLRRVGLLVLDDWGKHAATAWADERLFAAFDLRYREGMPTIVTTNADLTLLPQAVADRLVDRHCSTVVQFAGPSRRLV